ncbi:MAG: zf-HC2 domain-containing protein [Lachnospiraceae bacterium]|nr:zf-HC2 domain-containing protein [Lachnospiraceae bacterium]
MKDCNIVKDLLPLYIEELCSEDSKEYVEKHLKNCGECKESFEYLKYSELCVETVEKQEVNAFKKLERYISGKILISYFLLLAVIVVGTVVLLCTTAYTSVGFYYVLMPVVMVATGVTFRNVSSVNVESRMKKWRMVVQGILLAGSSFVLFYTMYAVSANKTTLGIPLYELGPIIDKILKLNTVLSMILLITHLYQVGRKQVRYSVWSCLSILCMFLSLLYDSFLYNMMDPLTAQNYLIRNTLIMYAVLIVIMLGMAVFDKRKSEEN